MSGRIKRPYHKTGSKREGKKKKEENKTKTIHIRLNAFLAGKICCKQLTGQKAYHADKFSTDKHSTMLVQRTTHTTPTHTLTSPPVLLVYQKQTNKCMQPTSTHQAESTTYKQIQLKQNNVMLVTETNTGKKVNEGITSFLLFLSPVECPS